VDGIEFASVDMDDIEFARARACVCVDGTEFVTLDVDEIGFCIYYCG